MGKGGGGPLTRGEGGPVEATDATLAAPVPATAINASPVARGIAAEHGLDLEAVKPASGRIQKADVLTHLANRTPSIPRPRLASASPKARRLAAERGLDLATLTGTGPQGAVLAADVATTIVSTAEPTARPEAVPPTPTTATETLSTIWRVMAERMTESWRTVPHFYLVREVEATRLSEWRAHSAPWVEKQTGLKVTYTDLFVKLLGTALRNHPRLNAAWTGDGLQFNPEINVGLATAVEEGLIVPVIHNADQATVSQIATQRHDLTERARRRKLRPVDLTGGTFTLTNLGMYNVDAFNAIVNPPQAAILAVGRIAERVVAVNGQPAVRLIVTLSLACDHRVVDGARAAQFLDDLANYIEDPWRLLA